MERLNAYDALAQVAKEAGLPVEKVREEIDFVIRQAMSNPDPQIRERWDLIPRKGEVPTAEEVIDFVALILSLAEE